MKILNHIRESRPAGSKLWVMLLLWVLCSVAPVRAQIVIGGSVYGGGDMADVGGNTHVEVLSGIMGMVDANTWHNGDEHKGNVYGGARLADVGGHTHVLINGVMTEPDPEDDSKTVQIAQTDYIVINSIYGGNDIAGQIKGQNEDGLNALVELTNQKTTKEGKEVNTKKIFIGQLFGGGNGAYYPVVTKTTGTGQDEVKEYSVWYSQADYEDVDENDQHKKEPIAYKTISTGQGEEFKAPSIINTKIDIKGGSIVYAYGGGNNATVTGQTTISMNNPSIVTNSIKDEDLNTTLANNNNALIIADANGELLTGNRFRAMGVSNYATPTSGEFQVGRLFGGNNMIEMAIQPKWDLMSGSARNVYSGGNKGAMTNSQGLLLEIAKNSEIVIDNLYGGCRMADVYPLNSGTLKSGVYEPTDLTDIQLTDKIEVNGVMQDKYKFPAGYSARVLVRGGDVNNVYGGNDITGNVKGGNAVGIYAKVRGDVYGGGNGSYPYTDNPKYANDDVYSDFYYNPRDILGLGQDADFTGVQSAQALNLFRPNAEQVSIRLKGDDEDNPTIIRGSVYLGGNSATIKADAGNVDLKIGSYVIVDNVFLGNNGEYMVDYTPAQYENNELIKSEGVLRTMKSIPTQSYGKLNSMDLTDGEQFATYMEGVAMSMIPTVSFDSKDKNDPEDYAPYSCYIGSFYGGGNRGSMTYQGTNNFEMNGNVVVYEKIVGGSNNAYVKAQEGYNADYWGGIIGTTAERAVNESGKTAYEGHDRLVMNFDGVKIEPRRWALKRGTGEYEYKYVLDNDKYIEDEDENGRPYLEWNTVVEGNNNELVPIYYKDRTWATLDPEELAQYTTEEAKAAAIQAASDAGRRLDGGNIYGGCHESGIVNGNIVININSDLEKRSEMFASDHETEQGKYEITTDPAQSDWKSGVILHNQAFDVLSVAMSVFGAGMGKDTYVWGSTTVNLNEGYTFQIFGGGLEGVVGKKDIPNYDEAYSTHVNLSGNNAGYSESVTNGPLLAEAEYLYGAGNEGDVMGNSIVNLGNGRIYDAFGGASDADVYGHTEVHIGRQPNGTGGYTDGFPWVRDIVYGGNDFGGTIKTEANFSGAVSNFAAQKIWNNGLGTTAAAYVEYLQGRLDTIFGGNYGNYNYDDPKLKEEVTDAQNNVTLIKKNMPYVTSTFVNISPKDNNSNSINAIFGGSTGYPGNRQGDETQDRSYVLIDIPYATDNFKLTQIFGSGSYGGLGMKTTVLPQAEVQAPGESPTPEQTTAYNNYLSYKTQLDKSTAVVDLIRGKVGAAYGGSYNEGITRRTMVNVPKGSTINIGSIFGGAYGNVTLDPCDVYESHVEYHSDDATLRYDPLRVEWEDDYGLQYILLGYDPEKTTPEQNESKLAAAIAKENKNGMHLAGNTLDKGSIYGGNNFKRRTLYAKINIDATVKQWNFSLPQYGYSGNGYVYGAGCGENTWAEYTEVNLNDGANVFEVYGGGQNGLVINTPSVQKYINEFFAVQGVTNYWDDEWKNGWVIGHGYDNGIAEEFTNSNTVQVQGKTIGNSTFYIKNRYTNLYNPLVTPRAEFGGKRFNTNVIINEGAYVGNYAYGGGLGERGEDPNNDPMIQSGNIYGTTYIALLGGEVKKDIYAAGTTGSIYDAFGVGPYAEGQSDAEVENDPTNKIQTHFTASTNAYILGGMARNVYGGGWQGNVGSEQIPGETDVVIGRRGITDADAARGQHFADGVPAIQRNAYGGGEGGTIFGTANITVNNGMIGYVHLNDNQALNWYDKIVKQEGKQYVYPYIPKVHDETWWDENDNWTGQNRLIDYGNVFGSGYDDLSSVDVANVTIYGGVIRSSVFGGGEIATVGRGHESNDPTWPVIDKAGKTHVEIYNGHVLRNVFGAGKGYNSLGFGGTHDQHTDGYVFGQTEVYIHGGEIGTDDGIELGYGNVFGGGDRGYVFSAYNFTDNNTEKVGRGKPKGKRYDGSDEGYYYMSEDAEYSTYLLEEGEKIMTEDCKVVIEPWLEWTSESPLEYPSGSGKKYYKGDYVPTTYLNTLPSKTKTTINGKETFGPWPEGWANLKDKNDGTDEPYVIIENAAFTEVEAKDTERGVIIHNAVFAGGNASTSDDNYASTYTVFGNATASIHDVYNRDFITIGTGRTGGLYGDGNLTFVAGYRELNITNYGTDFYHILPDIDNTTLHALPAREAAYYEIKYQYANDNPVTLPDGTTYSKGTSIPQDELYTLFAGTNYDYMFESGKPKSAYWVEAGVLLRAPGRSMNTIQRADFCGVFGSRMVMQGAEDRVPSTVDHTKYTINRVREVSLNKKETQANDTGDNAEHGNYFGIYSIVNYLGALTSDVDYLTGVRTTSNNNPKYASQGENETFAAYKNRKVNSPRERNNGNSHNQVALASGVYLEITTEQSTGRDFKDKVWGEITGVIELDLINVAHGLGGGFVYAKNVHGERKNTGLKQVTLSDLNDDAVTKKYFTYKEAVVDDKLEATGNFIHPTQPIVDDCYNITGKYYHDNNGHDSVAAHYWFVKGQIYVYDQIISAYTGTPNAYSELADIPLSISAGANGKLKLIDIQPNKYAYYSSVTYNGNQQVKTPLTTQGEVKINIDGEDHGFRLNDPISYWDWQKLTPTEKALFEDNTYYVLEECYINDNKYEAGQVLLESQYNTLSKSGTDGKKPIVKTKKTVGNEVIEYIVEDGFDFMFRPSNNVSHDNGYILTFDITNPAQWDKWYTLKESADADDNNNIKIKKALYEGLNDATTTEGDNTTYGKDKYHDGPTYRLKDDVNAGLYGQRVYSPGEVIPSKVYTDYQTAITNLGSEGLTQLNSHKPQAVFARAYIVLDDLNATDVNSTQRQLSTGSTIAKKEFVSNESSAWSSPFTETVFDGNGQVQTKGNVEKAFVCSSSFQLPKSVYEKEYIATGDLFSQSELADLKAAIRAEINRLNNVTGDNKDNVMIATLTTLLEGSEGEDGLLDSYIVDAYYNTSGSNTSSTETPVDYYYGGDYYESGKNYRGLAAWSSISADDRKDFIFNYDALDLLIDPDYKQTDIQKDEQNNDVVINYEGKKYLYDSAEGTYQGALDNAAQYSLPSSIDFKAQYEGSESIADEYGEITTGDIITSERYEKLLNEQGNYTQIGDGDITAGTYYVVKNSFVYKNEPFAVGELLNKEQFEYLGDNEKLNITTFTFEEGENGQNHQYIGKRLYYCYNEYEIAPSTKGGMPVQSLFDIGDIEKDDVLSSGKTVPVGFVIAYDDDSQDDEDSFDTFTYTSLTNKQKDFTIQGEAPVETSTLYVSRNSDIYDLSKEKIITVIYQYDYSESDEDGNVTPISERHVLNVHLQFKSGIPTVDDITSPSTVIPGTSVTIKSPNATEGAYKIIGRGWELFPNETYAESHTNGVEYVPQSTPLYWYQNGYYLAYYVKTYLGKTYSNHVPISVANYHDLAQVMDDKKYHLHVDYNNSKLKHVGIDGELTQENNNSKIYINNYTGRSDNKDGLDLLKDFIDLSMLDNSNVNTDANTGLITTVKDGSENPQDSPFKGHAKLNTNAINGVKGGQNLQFILRTNINHDPTIEWTPIANATGECFSGTLHGDGYTISGLDHSLIGHLCGKVYNLGVTGSFTGSGVADSGEGYVESCWINTTGTPISDDVYAVFSNQTSLVNSYYPNNLGYKSGIATPMPAESFFNGEVAFNLNSFYLNKRYYDNTVPDEGSYNTYKYIDSKRTDEPGYTYSDVNYPKNLTDYAAYGDLGYVEKRYIDGDFRYADGTIPTSSDSRMVTYNVTTGTGENAVTNTKREFLPKWPDDYLFFGQNLTYGYGSKTHQDNPSRFNSSNRVYRAPAYKGSSEMSVAYFNPDAVFAATVNGQPNQKIYQGLTAVDFTGYDDVFNPANGQPKAFNQGMGSDGKFYAPLTVFDGLTGFRNDGQTQNMLVYADALDTKTTDVLNSYFTEPDFYKYAFKPDAEGNTAYDEANTYQAIQEVRNDAVALVRGHMVVMGNNHAYTAVTDHFLVDKQDFNAPIAYTMGERKIDDEGLYTSNVMWYQRKPQVYVENSANGWESVSLPFTAQTVTTNEKGALTHFYSGNTDSHEYWLRTPVDVKQPDNENDKIKIEFGKPAAGSGTATRTTFLWDYYYNKSGHKDANDDTYQDDDSFYKIQKQYTNYPYAEAGTPYLIGFPGNRYYEFDLSGQFVAQNTALPAPNKLGPQTITFVSALDGNAEIHISDQDYTNVQTVGAYTFRPIYQKRAVGTNEAMYLLDSQDGSAFNNTVDGMTVPFRAYFTAVVTNQAPRRAGTRADALYIAYSGDSDQLQEIAADGGLNIYSQDMNIVIESTLDYEAEVTIYTVAAKLLKQFTIKPGTKVTVPVNNRGVYIVNHRKIAVTR